MRAKPPVQGHGPAAEWEKCDAVGSPDFLPALASPIPRAADGPADRPAKAVKTIALSYTIVVFAMHGLKAPWKVELFDHEGNVPGEIVTTDARGACIATIANGYAGPLLVKISPGEEGEADFAEAAGQWGRRACLRAVTVASGRGNLALAVTPLTEFATLSMGIVGDAANVHPATIESVNRAVGRRFGLDDVTGVRHGTRSMSLSLDPAVVEAALSHAVPFTIRDSVGSVSG